MDAIIQNHSMSVNEKYMRRCLEIAKNGMGTTAPNPSVGAVIVHNDRIIGEGYTSPFGGPHAEVNAICSVKDKTLLSKSTLYVTLEPCSHFGKTPPCANFIVENKIPKVVIGLKDPHEKVAGKGMEILEKAGCSVTMGVLEKECREHHRRFLTFHEQKRPYIVLKWAETADGFIAPIKELRNSKAEPYWITNTYSRQLVHKWRSEEQAILVGTNTVLEDNPKLDTRLWKGSAPIRLIIDKNRKIPKGFHVLDGKQPTIVISSINNLDNKIQNYNLQFIEFNDKFILGLSKNLFVRNILSVFVEGGAKTLQAFIDANLWDEARIFIGKNTFEKGIKAPTLQGQLTTERSIVNDQLKIIRNDKKHHI
ncbi:bifunctional diaminohydroxyphosphoribosylaminopyrimidine deaminase/5-amino-6-(5-phosphoribosylamino)uracil reductase RibD [Maribacter flavus]|nr:bifunctional diaminohydroxyphosphoribosylaminopyrimidine deaminase/5-amino-6-(5-phosphoribosylamino)uracil reductase RibD [Maribacter flavus]